jgi:hypothetical protein
MKDSNLIDQYIKSLRQEVTIIVYHQETSYILSLSIYGGRHCNIHEYM